MNYENLLLVTTDGVATLTINRPKALNALNSETLHELDRAFAELESDSEIRAVILTGAGEKAFVAGGDISAMQSCDPVAAREMALLAQSVFDRIERSPKPVIAAINGFALGGGCELALCCDLRIAGESAKLAQPEINLGIIPGWAGTQRLPRLIGKGRALELLLTGDMITAKEAERIGLVNHVTTDGELLQEALQLARKISGKPPVALKLIKEAVHQGEEMDLARANALEAEKFGLCFATEDQKEGMAAFLEKRSPKFRGC
ncbi:MAG: enoyl-CoA hydratase-related protein [Desulfuromonadales bacterium]